MVQYALKQKLPWPEKRRKFALSATRTFLASLILFASRLLPLESNWTYAYYTRFLSFVKSRFAAVLTDLDLKIIAAGQERIERIRTERRVCKREYPNFWMRKELWKLQAKVRPVRKPLLPLKQDYPVRFYTLMGVHASKRGSGIGGAWRIYVIAKSLVENGNDRVERDKLQEFILSLGVQPRTLYNWMRDARNYGLIIDVQDKDDIWQLVLPCPAIASLHLNIPIGNHTAKVDVSLLVGKGWKSYVWAAHEATFKGKQISRDKLCEQTGVPHRTQAYRDKQAGVKHNKNYCGSQYGADSLPMLQEHSKHKALFVASNKNIYWRLSDSREVASAVYTGRGNSKNQNRKLNRCGSHRLARASSDDSPTARLYHRESRTALKTLRESDVTEVYQYAYDSYSLSSIWLHRM